MIYEIDFTEEAKKDISKLKRSEPGVYKKLVRLINELREHPKTGQDIPNHWAKTEQVNGPEN